MSEFEELKQFLESDEWPEAVSPESICDKNSEVDKRDRGETIVDLFLPPIEGKKVLDFGCGEGHTAQYANKNCEKAIGYDIEKQGQLIWECEETGCLLTQNIEILNKYKPFDIICLYDVLDHANADPAIVLQTAKSLLANDGEIHIRFHPWCSRHGAHLYNQINKAFIQLVFSREELRELGYEYTMPVIEVIRPIDTYSNWIERAGLNIKNRECNRNFVEFFFKDNEIIKDRITKTLNLDEWDTWQLEQTYVDIVAAK